MSQINGFTPVANAQASLTPAQNQTTNSLPERSNGAGRREDSHAYRGNMHARTGERVDFDDQENRPRSGRILKHRDDERVEVIDEERREVHIVHKDSRRADEVRPATDQDFADLWEILAAEAISNILENHNERMEQIRLQTANHYYQLRKDAKRLEAKLADSEKGERRSVMIEESNILNAKEFQMHSKESMNISSSISEIILAKD